MSSDLNESQSSSSTDSDSESRVDDLEHRVRELEATVTTLVEDQVAVFERIEELEEQLGEQEAAGEDTEPQLNSETGQVTDVPSDESSAVEEPHEMDEASDAKTNTSGDSDDDDDDDESSGSDIIVV